MADVQWAVQVAGLVKSFGDKRAVNGIDLAVPRGTFYGLLGPNGAGKSTTLSMLTGLLRPDAGLAKVAGVDVWQNPIELKSRIGVVPETLLLFERLSGREMLHYVGRLRNLPVAEIGVRSGELLAVLDLDEAADKLVVDYSQGMRKKISLAAALLHAPEVLFLDEPFESVDPVSVRVIRSVLDQLVGSGATVVFSSHVMATVESLCDFVTIMDHGNVVAGGATEMVKAGGTLEDAFAAAVGAETLDPTSLSWLRQRSEQPLPERPAPPPPPTTPPQSVVLPPSEPATYSD